MKKKILIVDDDPITINLLRLILEPAGYETCSAQNGVDALKMVAETTPDIILLDIMMPIMDGLTVCKELRTQAETKTLPILILSTNALASSVKAVMAAGATKYLFKPISRDNLIQEVNRAISNHQISFA